MANEAVEPLQSPFCGSLRSKKFFMLDRLATSADEYLDAANHVWCCETQEVTTRRIDTSVVDTSAVWQAAAMVKEK